MAFKKSTYKRNQKRGGKNNDCVVFSVKDEGLYIETLERCGILGSKMLEKIEEFARRTGLTKISLYDSSSIWICDQEVDLAYLKILTKGESRYNSLGYKVNENT